MERARAEIQLERDGAIADLRREFADLTITAAERVIRRSLDRDAHNDLIEQVLAEAPQRGDRRTGDSLRIAIEFPEPAARRYAEAAYLIAREDGTAEAWLAGLARWPRSSATLRPRGFFANSRVPPDRSAQLVEKALAGADQNVLNLALLLLRRRRTSLGPQIAQAYQEILDREKGISHALS